MKKILLLFLIVISGLLVFGQQKNSGDETSWKESAPNGDWNATHWYNVTRGWDNHNPNYEGDRELVFDNNNQLSMTNNFTGVGLNIWKITLTSNATSARVINGTSETIFINAGSQPKIENFSIGEHSINFPIKINFNPIEINPVNGNLNIGGALDNNGNYIDVYGTNSKELDFSSSISGSGGLTIKENSKVLYTNIAKAYSGVTTLNTGVLELQVSAENTDITVKNGATLSINGANVIVKSITVEAGGSVEVLAGKSLTVSNNLSNSGTVTLKSDGSAKPAANATGSLIVNGTITGDVTVNLDIAQYSAGHDGWHLLSLPVDGLAIASSQFKPTSGDDDLFKWHEASSMWQNYYETTFTTFDKGIGYLCAYKASATKTFTDEVVNNNVTLSSLSYSGEGVDDDWHLLGNPFTSALDITAGTWTFTNISVPQIYSESSKAYVAVNSLVGDEQNIIPAMQGFFVQTTNATNSITIPKDGRVHNSTAWHKETNEGVSSIKLELTNDQVESKDIVMVAFDDNSTDNYDIETDSRKLFSLVNVPQFYILNSTGEKFSVNFIENDGNESVIPLNFRATDQGTYHIGIAENELEEMTKVFLEDKLTNQIVELIGEELYSFTANEGDDENRFMLYFKNATGVEEFASEDLQAFVSGQNLVIHGEEGDANLSIYDIQGKQIVYENVKLNSNYKKALSLQSGVYIIKVQNSELIKTTKVIIK